MRSDACAIARLARVASEDARVTVYQTLRSTDARWRTQAEVSVRFHDREMAERFAALVNAERMSRMQRG
ncbi:MAG TPA: hypothetical protein PKE15_00150 [Ottowia sp.]|nr:hypothetical protein [Ottowia sp.]